jgi:hypothetical protein
MLCVSGYCDEVARRPREKKRTAEALVRAHQGGGAMLLPPGAGYQQQKLGKYGKCLINNIGPQTAAFTTSACPQKH